MMARQVSEDDWKEYTFPHVTNSIFATVANGQAMGFHLFWVAQLYKLYRLGNWKNEIPAPESLPDKTYLMWHDEEYCLFHKKHDTFGANILECACPYGENIFVFFDYASLHTAFDALDADEQVPYIPTYYAHPHDRHDYKTGAHMW